MRQMNEMQLAMQQQMNKMQAAMQQQMNEMQTAMQVELRSMRADMASARVIDRAQQAEAFQNAEGSEQERMGIERGLAVENARLLAENERLSTSLHNAEAYNRIVSSRVVVKQEQVVVKREQVDAATMGAAQAQAQAEAAAAAAASAQGEVEQLQQTLECCICLDATASVVLVPCGHRLCKGCAQTASSTCPQCRDSVKSLQNMF